MKTIIVLLITLAASFGSFAQKAKNNLPPDTSAAQQVTYICPMHPGEMSSSAGTCSKCGMALTQSTKEQMKSGIVKAFDCPMHQDQFSNKAGKCTKCGTTLVRLNTYACPSHPDMMSNKPGVCTICGKALVLTGKEQMKTELMKQYTCPMHADVTSDKPGKCSKCGMALVEKNDKNPKRN